jgi:hypothetical protein
MSDSTAFHSLFTRVFVKGTNAMVGASPPSFLAMYAGANMGHPSITKWYLWRRN